MADYALLIVYLKETRLSNAKNSPVIAFGASYGGDLAAWMRIKVNFMIKSHTLVHQHY